MKTSYYISFLSSGGSFLVSTWCDLSALLKLQKICKGSGFKIVQRTVHSERLFQGPFDADGIFSSAVCSVG